MPYKPAEITHVLTAVLGFTLEKGPRGDDHKWYKLEIDGVPRTIRTFVSHGRSKQYDKGLESKVARELHVSAPFFRQIMRGEKTREDYIHEVKTNPHPPFH